WDAVGREPTHEPQNFTWRQKGRNTIFSGHGAGPNDNDDDVERYFRAVDEVVCEQLKDGQAPLVLAGPSELWPLYRAVSRYPRLIEGGVEGNVDRDRPEIIHARAWPLVERLFEEPLRELAGLYREMAAKGRASDDLAAVAAAVAAGRAAALLLAADGARGAPDAEAAGGAAGGDLLEDLAEETLRQSGKVYVLPPGLMPTDAPAAALFRY
ncbi:MAG: hypothetical protein NTZ05_20470, partial [Chloroflexi bacterium]|nr:hypothetical protein [Chloroflexota bacterium]